MSLIASHDLLVSPSWFRLRADLPAMPARCMRLQPKCTTAHHWPTLIVSVAGLRQRCTQTGMPNRLTAGMRLQRLAMLTACTSCWSPSNAMLSIRYNAPAKTKLLTFTTYPV